MGTEYKMTKVLDTKKSCCSRICVDFNMVLPGNFVPVRCLTRNYRFFFLESLVLRFVDLPVLFVDSLTFKKSLLANDLLL